MWQLTISGDRGTFTSRDSIVAEYESRDAALAAYDSHCLAAALVGFTIRRAVLRSPNGVEEKI